MGNRSSQKSVWTASKGTRKRQVVLASDLFLKAWAFCMTNEEAVVYRSILEKDKTCLPLTTQTLLLVGALQPRGLHLATRM